MSPDFRKSYTRYNNVLKPLVSEIEGRLEQFEEPLLTNLFYFFDCLALSAFSDEQGKSQYLSQGERYLDTCISVSYQYLIYALEVKMQAFGKQTRNVDLNMFEDGRFIGRFTELKRKAEGAVRMGERAEDHVAGLPSYKEAYEYYLKLEKLVDNQKPNLVLAQYRKSNLGVKIFQWVSGVLISVAAGYYHTELNEALINWWNNIL